MTSRLGKISGTTWLAIGASLALGAAILFLELAEEVAEDETRRLDIAALRWLAAHRSPMLNHFFVGASALGSWPFVSGLTFCLCVAGALRGKRRPAATLAAAVLGIPALIVALKPLYARPRPDVVAHLDLVDSASFPSGHALAASIFFGTVAIIAAQDMLRDGHRALVVSGALCMIGLVALARVYLGVHYPSDVLGGILVGTTWSLLVVLAGHLLK